MATSFLNEHSVEFVLVPQFAQILSASFNSIIPIFFWASREGNNVSKQCLESGKVKVVALFARRPKIDLPGQHIIEVKFNEGLFLKAADLRENGIPVFAGVPLASSIANFQLSTTCVWFNINPGGHEEVTHLPVRNQEQALVTSENVKKMDANEILTTINSQSRAMAWSEAINIFRKAKFYSSGNFIHSLFGEIYKPVYFILLD